MDVTVKLHGFDHKHQAVRLDPAATYNDLLRTLGIPSETVIVFVDDRPVPTSDPVQLGPEVRVVRIVSGGAV